MNLIVAVDENWAIGNKNDLLIRIPADHKMFRQETTGKVVVLGNPSYKVKDAVVVHSVEELLKELEKYNTEDIYIIGGESIYRQMLPYCDVAHVTKIDYAYTADAYFPDLDQLPEWEITADSEEQTYFDIAYHFVKYERTKPE